MEFGAGSQVSNGTSANGEAFRRRVAAAYVNLLADLKQLDPVDGLALAQRGQREYAALEAMHLAALKASGASNRDVERKSAAGGTRSRKGTSKVTTRASAVGENPELAHKLGAADIGAEQLDALAHASSKSGGDAAKDAKLIEEIENSKPDDAGKITQRWLERRDEDGSQSRFDRQNSRRGARKGFDRATGCDTFELRGPSERINEIKKRTEERAHEMYVADGGRDVPDHEHQRTHQQRMFDAGYELLMGQHQSVGSSSPSTLHPRAMIHVSLTVDAKDERLIRAACPDGGGYLPESVLDKYGCESVIGGTVFNARGQPIWFGRQRRYASRSQFAALIARDGGCVLCGRDPSRCEAHHLDPFNSPSQGETNVENMALVCTSCHHGLHDSKRTLIWRHAPPNRGPDDAELATGANQKGARRVWSTRPATSSELAPARHSKPRADSHNARSTRRASRS